jgi:sterol desaturase/sphingolipid hydroxylase (fatty acid hydroxylase superfamily)
MTVATGPGGTVALFGIMGALAILESVAPFRGKGAWRRGRLAGNVGLNASTLTLNFVLGLGGAIACEVLRGHGFGLLSGRAISWGTLVGVSIVALDLATYIAHWLMHRVPGFWRVHRVHHSDPLVDVTTAYRQHPLESVMRFSFIMATAWALGLPAEVVAVYRLVSAWNALLEHADVKLWQPLDGLLSLAVVTPNMHKVHHSRAQGETDSNYGNILSTFDRIFRTFTPTSRAAHVQYGLDGYDAAEAHRFTRLMALPFQGN